MLGHVFWSIRHCILISRNLWLIRFLLSLHLLGQFEEAISRVSFFPDVTVVGIILLLVGFKECQDICSLARRGWFAGAVQRVELRVGWGRALYLLACGVYSI